jgi:nucleotide-binding universal stress UspA family protein
MKIVVGHHDTSEARAALQRAAELAESEPAELHIVHFAQLPDDEEDAYKYVAAREQEQQASDALAARLRASGIVCEVHHVHDAHEPAEAILGVAHEVDADLIVIGMRRRTRVGKLIFGSTAQTILIDSECPVLSVKAPHA